MKVLVGAGLVQSISTPLLMIVVMQITNDRRIMGALHNTANKLLGWLTAVVMLAALVGLVLSILLPPRAH